MLHLKTLSPWKPGFPWAVLLAQLVLACSGHVTSPTDDPSEAPAPQEVPKTPQAEAYPDLAPGSPGPDQPPQGQAAPNQEPSVEAPDSPPEEPPEPEAPGQPPDPEPEPEPLPEPSKQPVLELLYPAPGQEVLCQQAITAGPGCPVEHHHSGVMASVRADT